MKTTGAPLSTARRTARLDLPLRAPPIKKTRLIASEVQAPTCADAAVEGVLDLTHLGHRVGELDEQLGCIAAGRDDVHVLGSVADRVEHVVDRQPTVVDGIRDLVEHDELVLAAGDRRRCELPGGDRPAARLIEVGRLPGEAVTPLQPVDAESSPDRLLPDLPLVGLDELDHAHLPAARDAAHHDPERGRRLALAVAGVDEYERTLARRSHATPASSRICKPQQTATMRPPEAARAAIASAIPCSRSQARSAATCFEPGRTTTSASATSRGSVTQSTRATCSSRRNSSRFEAVG